MSTVTRAAWAIFCDDVRLEMGNKHSLMGTYEKELFVPAFPITLAKLCVVAYARTSISQPFRELRFQILKDDEIMAEAKIDVGTITAPTSTSTSPDEEAFVGKIVCMISPFQLPGPCKLSAKAITEAEELRGGGILVKLAQEKKNQLEVLSTPQLDAGHQS